MKPRNRPGFSGLGGKALRLSALSRAGLRVPPFTVVRHGDLDRASWRAKCVSAGLAVPLIARSCARGEDDSVASFAGAFLSVKVASWEDLPKAVDDVRGSISSPGVAEYARALSVPVPTEMDVIVQSFVEADLYGAYLFDGSRESVSATVEFDGATSGGGTPVPLGDSAPAVLAACRAAAAATVPAGFPCDVEWAYRAGEAFILQSRPFARSSRR